MDLLAKNLHFIFLAYALWIGNEYYVVQSEALVEAEARKISIESKLSKVEKQLEKVKSFEEDMEQSQKRVQDVVEKIKTIQTQLPSEILDTEINGRFTDYSDQLKMVKANPSPGAEKNNNFYISKEYNFDAQGTFLQFLIFFEKLSNSERILNVKYLRIKTSEDGDKRSRFQLVDLTTTVEAYKYNADYNPRAN